MKKLSIIVVALAVISCGSVENQTESLLNEFDKIQELQSEIDDHQVKANDYGKNLESDVMAGVYDDDLSIAQLKQDTLNEMIAELGTLNDQMKDLSAAWPNE